MDSKNLSSCRVSLKMETPHGGKRVPLLHAAWLHAAWLAINDSATKSIFADSQMVLCLKVTYSGKLEQGIPIIA